MRITLKDIARYYWPHVKKYKIQVFFGIGLAIAGGVVSNALTPLVYKRIIDITTGGHSAMAAQQLWFVVIIFAFLMITSNALWRATDFLHLYAQSKILRDLMQEAFAKVGDHSQAFFLDTFVGSLVSKAQRYLRSFRVLHDIVVYNIFANIATLVVMLGVLTWLKPILALVFLIWFIVYVLISVWFLKRQIPRDLEYAAAQSKTTGVFADAITNILTIKMFSNFFKEKKYIATVTDFEEKRRMVAWTWENWQQLFKSIAVLILNVTVIAIVILLWIRGEATAGTIVLVQVYIFGLSEITWNLGKQVSRFTQALNDAKEMVEIFEEPRSVTDRVNPEKLRIVKGQIEFDHVTFAYNDGHSIFNNLDIIIPAGQKVGLVGRSGAGKTTITKLLLRFTDIESGEIKIDEQNIVRITQDDLRSSISYVPQEPILFHRSLSENIAYGKPDATKEEIITASKQAHAHEFIQKLQYGYDTLVGERGVKLSGGERQRVAIARALLKNAPILILDEATSSLDSISERYIQEALEELMKGRTTLVIAHRLSTIQHMDRILVFHDGKVIEDDTHANLTEIEGGVYQELWKEQSSGFVGK